MAYSLLGWERFFEELAAFIRTCDQQSGTANQSFSEYALERIQTSILSVSSLVHHIDRARPNSDAESAVLEDYSTKLTELLSCLRELSQQWESHIDRCMQLSCTTSYAASSIHTSRRGRPKFDITREQLEFLASMSFTWTQIARMLGVSHMTVYRRRVEFQMVQSVSGTLSDNELKLLLTSMRREHPSMGQTMVWGRLRSMGFNVTRERVRRAIRVTDPLYTALRWRGDIIQRQPYSVPGPNSLWHLDGHHKLIRWRFVTHCSIDGYSRLVVFIKCSTNNKAATVYDLFLQAVQRYGLPSRVRCDQGGENILVAQHMLRHRGSERRSVLVGSSVHNQRIERLWRDMHRCVTVTFYRLFYYLEYHGLLNPIDDIHIFAVHYVYLPRINKSLLEFKDAWNSHKVRTEQGFTPSQLFTSGALRLRESGLSALDFFDRVSDNYGVEEDGVTPYDDDEGVEVPPCRLNLSEDQLEELKETVDPLSDSDNFGIDLYERALIFLQSTVATDSD